MSSNCTSLNVFLMSSSRSSLKSLKVLETKTRISLFFLLFLLGGGRADSVCLANEESTSGITVIESNKLVREKH